MTQQLKIIPTKHFAKRLGERYFNLSVISKIHLEIAKQPQAKLIRVTSGGATIVAEVKDNGIVKLITGWIDAKNVLKGDRNV